MLTSVNSPSSLLQVVSNGDDDEEEELEFRSFVDDTWYSVRVAFDGRAGGKLIDSVYEAGKFFTFEELDDFASRFRPVSVQLQDSECRDVVADGLLVCASHAFTDNDVLFYDAVVEQPGPNANSLTEKKIESICIVQSIQNLSPNLASFIKMSKEKIKTYAHTSSSVSDATGTNCNDATGVQSLKQASQATKCVKQSASDISPCEEVGRSSNLLKRNREDADFGGVGNYYTMLLENVEKELSPLTIIEFIRRQTSITGQAYVLPSLSSERYSRSVIVLDFQKDLEDLCGFLNNPDHFIVSSKGRPWVVAKNFSRHDIFRASSIGTPMFASQRILQNGNCWNGDELKVVRSGTEEYKTAKELRDLLVEFTSHQERLHKSLAFEERKILKSSPEFEASLQKSSRWSNYISALPRQPYSLLYWTRAELDRYLEASQIRERVIERITNVIGTYNDLRLRIFSKYPDIFPEEVFNLEMFKWSFSIRFSRLVWLPSMGGRVALVPWAYMLNHNCRDILDYDKSTKGIAFTTDRQYQPGKWIDGLGYNITEATQLKNVPETARCGLVY
ncbi:hypothetical protein Q3G72_029507 [Acer saccharum]|nr:hypothetical protein Q3G72_029507 [Acer saccharum]